MRALVTAGADLRGLGTSVVRRVAVPMESGPVARGIDVASRPVEGGREVVYSIDRAVALGDSKGLMITVADGPMAQTDVAVVNALRDGQRGADQLTWTIFRPDAAPPSHRAIATFNRPADAEGMRLMHVRAVEDTAVVRAGSPLSTVAPFEYGVAPERVVNAVEL